VTVHTEATDQRYEQPRSLIVTIYGLYAREAGGWISVAALIRLMAELGVDEPAVRSSTSRLKRRGMLEAGRLDGAAGYRLSDQARDILSEGDHRIFQRPAARISDGWLLAVFSVPETERQKRHMLRSRLSALGFGTAAAGVWVAPAHLYDDTRRALERLRLTDYVDLFRSDYLAFGDLHAACRRTDARRALERLRLTDYVDLFRSDYLAFGDLHAAVRTWWDLDELRELYDEFLQAHRPVLAQWRRRRGADDAQAFADYVRSLTQWRRLPYLDPGLPAELLPRHWHGRQAGDLLFALQDVLAEPAARHVHAVTSRPGVGTGLVQRA
jgi:phenylacetic acid degradation operon negative regulatory protein